MATWEVLNYKHPVDPSLSPKILFGELHIIGGLGLKLVFSSKKILQMFQLHPTEPSCKILVGGKRVKMNSKRVQSHFYNHCTVKQQLGNQNRVP